MRFSLVFILSFLFLSFAHAQESTGQIDSNYLKIDNRIQQLEVSIESSIEEKFDEELEERIYDKITTATKDSIDTSLSTIGNKLSAYAGVSALLALVFVIVGIFLSVYVSRKVSEIERIDQSVKNAKNALKGLKKYAHDDAAHHILEHKRVESLFNTLSREHRHINRIYPLLDYRSLQAIWGDSDISYQKHYKILEKGALLLVGSSNLSEQNLLLLYGNLMFKYYLGRLLCSADLFTKLYDIQNPKILAGNLIFTSAKQEIIYYYSSEIEELMSSVNREKDNLNDSCIQVFKTKIYDKIVQITSPESLKNYNEKLGEEILNRMNP